MSHGEISPTCKPVRHVPQQQVQWSLDASSTNINTAVITIAQNCRTKRTSSGCGKLRDRVPFTFFCQREALHYCACSTWQWSASFLVAANLGRDLLLHNNRPVDPGTTMQGSHQPPRGHKPPMILIAFSRSIQVSHAAREEEFRRIIDLTC